MKGVDIVHRLTAGSLGIATVACTGCVHPAYALAARLARRGAATSVWRRLFASPNC